ncbi:MAG TPA: hypothetical protein VKW06_18600 [Candidatus Angelobacter sp.]|nr:hypothetical protein [Candidatus Angelobacter sp.]
MKSQLRRKSTSTVATRILWCVPICLLIVAAIFTATKSPAQTVATIVTSQKFYSVGETMTVLGKGFTPGVGIAISVLRPDHQTDVVNGTIADGTGSFSSNYTPPLMPGRYKITATDGTNSATTATTEADSIGFNKAVYDKNDQTYAGGAGHWTTGNAGSNYLEGQWAFYQYEVTGVTSRIPDFDVDFNHFQTATNAVFIDGFANFRACLSSTTNGVETNSCEDTTTGGPTDGLLSDGNPFPPTNTTHWVSALPAISNINRPLDASGGCSSNTPDPVNAPTEIHCFHVTGDTLAGLVGGVGAANTTYSITLYYAAHLARSSVWTHGHESLLGCFGDPNYVIRTDGANFVGMGAEFIPAPAASATDPIGIFGTDAYEPDHDACGPVNGADGDWTSTAFFGIGSASGSSRHFTLANPEIDGQSVGSQGAITLPIPSVPAPTGTITIVKVTNPANSGSTTFPFSGDLGNFTLDTNSGDATFPNSITFPGLEGGLSYSVSESEPAGWTPAGTAVCVNNTGTSTFSNLTGTTATINLAGTSGASVTCTFTNNGAGHIIVQKHTNPAGSAQSFTYTTTGTGYTGFSLTDGGSNTDGGTPPTGGLAPGAYTISETTPVNGWVLTSRTCSLTTTGSGTSTFPASGTTQPASISLGAGDTVTCVYTNTKPDARITLSPPSATNAVGSAHTFTATVQQNTGSGFTNAPDGTTVAFSLLNNTAGAAFVGPSTCTTTAGSCSISVNSTTAGSVNIQATTTFSVLGISLTRTTGDGLSGDSGNSTKTWVDLKISINPLTATNEINTPHTFTATVQQNPGTGFVNVPDGTTITFSLSNNTANASFVGPNTCTTTAGSCSITITGTQAGSVTITASSTVTVSGVSLTRTTGDGLSGDSVSAVKTFISSSTTLTLKSAPTSVEAGALVTIVVTETNTGNGPLTNVNVTGGGSCASFSPASVTLAAGASQDFTCTFTAAAGPNAWSALGHGTDSLGNPAPATNESQSGSVLGLLSKLVVVKHTVGGNGAFQFTATGADVPASFTETTSGGTATAIFAAIHSGPKSVTETVPAGWLGNTTNVACSETAQGITPSVIGTLTTGEVAAGGTITANVSLGIGATVECDFTNALLPTLTIVKTIQGSGTATFTFPVTGDNTLNPTITPPTAPSTATFPPGPPTPPPGVVLNVGSNGTTSNNTITESPIPAGWTLTDFTCTGNTGGGAGAGPLDSNGVPTNWNFIANFGDNVVCTFVDNNAQATRTQGFWATHTALANEVWGGNGTTFPSSSSGSPVTGSPDASLCGVTITAFTTPLEENVLMGGFWANISHTSAGKKRLAIDQARMQMLQQYFAAVLNVHFFGSGSEQMLVDARTAYCSGNASAIQAEIGILGTFNSQGDTLGTTPGGSATTKTSKAQADIDAWDQPGTPGLGDDIP